MIAALLWELKQRRMFAVWWALGVSILIGVTNLSYLALGDQSEELDEALGGLTESAGGFFGGTDFFSPVGFLSSQIYFIMLPLLLIIMGTTLASRLLAKDENDGTIELTLSRPVSRISVLGAKALAGLAVMLFVGLVSYAVCVATVVAADIDIDQGNLALTHLLAFGFSASFGVIAFALLAASRETRKIAAVVAIVLSFGGYVLTSLASFVDQLEQVVKVVPYYYYDTAALLTGTVDKGLLIYIGGVFIVGTVVAALGYSRRDIG